MAWYGDVSGGVDDSLIATRSGAEQQAGALMVLVNTFKGADGTDAALRAAALSKLASLGKARGDVAPLLSLMRNPPTATDLSGATEAVKGIVARAGSTDVPLGRGRALLRASGGQTALGEGGRTFGA